MKKAMLVYRCSLEDAPKIERFDDIKSCRERIRELTDKNMESETDFSICVILS